MNRARVAIVGGGLSGLYAAWRLQQQGMHEHVLLEARGRLGGRIARADAGGAWVPADAGGAWTPADAAGAPAPDDAAVAPAPADAAGAPAPADAGGLAGFDLGPTWYWPGVQPQLDRLVDALGLQRFAQFEEGDLVVERSPHAPPARMRGYRSAPPSMRLAGGMGALVDALHQRLQGGCVVTGHRVHGLRLADGHVEVLAEADGGRGAATMWQVDHVLLALPPRLAARDLVFTPALPPALRRQWQATDTWMAPHAKYLAVYDTPFWRAQGLSGGARSACGPLAEVHDASMPGGPAALFGFVGVPARVRQGIAEDALKAQCRAQLGRLFGAQALAPRAEVFKDWAADALTAADADLDGGGQHPEPPAGAADSGPWQGRFTGIASEWSLQFPGYLAGAVDAAERGVQGWWASAVRAGAGPLT